MKEYKKIIILASMILVIALGILITKNQGISAKILGLANDPPAITNAFTDKEKYFPGDIMAITAETKDASAVKALVENEKGFNAVNLVAVTSFEGKETWAGKWKVENSQNGKKYKIKIVASNKSGTAETVLEWEDPNPGHPWSQIDGFPSACTGTDFVKGLGASLSCATPGGLSSCTIASSNAGASNGSESWVSATCPATYTLTGGGCDLSEYGSGHYTRNHPNGANGWYCLSYCGAGGCPVGSPLPLVAYAVCCK